MTTTPDRHTGPDGAARESAGRRGRHHLLRPWWLVAHVVVLAILVAFPMLSAWQWQRWQEERATAAAIEQGLAEDPVDLATVLGPGSVDAATADDLEFTPVTVRGTWLGDAQVAQRNRSLAGTGGFDLLTPLLVADGPLAGTAVVVRRGWVPPSTPAGADPTPDEPVTGVVEVTGFLEVPGTQPSFGPTDDVAAVRAATQLPTVFHADLDLFVGRVDAPLAGMVVHLTTQVPDDGQLPVPQPAPEHDASQNLSYALQWAAFTIIVVGGYALVLWRRVRDHRAGIDSDIDPLLRDRPTRLDRDTRARTP